MTQANRTAEAAHPGIQERIDPELVALPAPPRGRRFAAMVVMALTVVASLGLLTSLRADIDYFFAEGRAVDLGDVGTIDAARLSPNTFVHVRGTPMASGTVRYSRVLSGGAYTVFPLAGQRTVFVQMPVDDPDRSRLEARREFTGRLVTFGDLGGRFSQIRQYLGGTMEMPVSSESFLLLADEPPGSYGWALGLAGICILFILINIGLMLRWFRPLPRPPEPVPDLDPEP